MATTYRELIASASLTATVTTYYTAPALTAAAIHAASVSNGTATPVVVNLYKVAVAGTPANPQLIASRTVPANSVLTLHDAINHKLEAGSQLYASGLGCGLNVSGVEYVKET